MKIPNYLTVRQAVVLAVAALFAAVFIAVFGPVVAYGLGAVAFIAGAYAAVLQWAPEFVEQKKAP